MKSLGAFGQGCLAVLLLLPIAVDAQSTAGLFAGANVTAITGAGGYGVTNNAGAGLLVGALVVFPIAPMAGIQVETAYAQKRGEQESRYTVSPLGCSTMCPQYSFSDYAKERLDYIESGVLARVGPQLGKRRRSGYVIGGLAFSKLLSAGARQTGSTGQSYPETDISNQITAGDVNLVVGAGALIGRVGIEGRYDWGLVALDKGSVPNLDRKTRTFSILFGAHFQLRAR